MQKNNPDELGYYYGSGEWSRTTDLSGMNRTLSPTKLRRRNSSFILPSLLGAVKKFLSNSQKDFFSLFSGFLLLFIGFFSILWALPEPATVLSQYRSLHLCGGATGG